MTANADGAVRHIEQALHAAIDGRRAARALAAWTKRFALSEPEFQVLWRLRQADDAGFDQTKLAAELACSPAQISATVERMRARGWICQRVIAEDRRRHLWQLSPAGHDQVEQLLCAAAELRLVSEHSKDFNLDSASAREAAA